MAIIKNQYELSVWNEILLENGTKQETKSIIIGAHDMDYLGRAIDLKFTTKINGTHSLTFRMISKFFDSKEGKFVENDFIDYLFNERKLKLYYKDNWYEFYIKTVNESKKDDTVYIDYTCSDAFVEELSRNGYGIIFDTELYNNVEEIGTFTEKILEGSIWKYNSKYNWGDFTEYTEEKLFKIPVTNFNSISGYHLKFECDDEIKIENAFTGEKRELIMSDDKARELNYFWDCGQYDEGFELTSELKTNIENDGYIYVPYSCLNFCYITESSFESTEVPYEYNGNYALSPTTIDPSSLIQFISIPNGAEIEVDEEGLLLNKEYHYVMTVEQWNQSVNSNKIYLFEDVKNKAINVYKDNSQYIHGNKIVSYEGYLESYNGLEIKFGKKISVTDRTECNISEDVDQYVKVYQNLSNEYFGEFNQEKWCGGTDDYRICSKQETRNIIPQLARNFIQNSKNMQSTDGWEVMKIYDGNDLTVTSAKIELQTAQSSEDGNIANSNSALVFTPLKYINGFESDSYRTILNFGAVGQELILNPNKTYCLKWNFSTGSNTYVIIGDGTTLSNGEYGFKDEDKVIKIPLNLSYGAMFFKPNFIIENPYIGICVKDKITIYDFYLFEAYTKGIDFFENGYFRYSGRDLFSYYINNSANNYLYSKTYFLDNYLENEEFHNLILFEDDVMTGGYYTQTKYFIQQLKIKNSNLTCDTFKAKGYLSEDGIDSEILQLPLDSSKYTEDDYEIVTNYIDLGKCKFYNAAAAHDEFDCNYGKENRICLYQKYGYCPYRFKTQKHCRKIRTLSGEKSNRFNLTQELSKVFEIYPMYYSKHEENGKIPKDENGQYEKSVFYITEKGNEHHLGFKYKHNVKGITRKKISDSIVTKLYVNDVDSELSKTGLCSIKTAEDNPSKDSFIIDFSYYTKMGLLDEKKVENDLYGTNEDGLAFLKTLGYYNKNYDELSNNIINLQNSSLNELEANLYVNLEGIETAQKELIKIKKQKDRFIGSMQRYGEDKLYENLYDNETYKSYIQKYNEQYTTLTDLIKTTFYDSDGVMCLNPLTGQKEEIKIENFLDDKVNIPYIKEKWVDTHEYLDYGILGQYNTEYNQIQDWKKERAKYLKWANKLSLQFYQIYESYLKEGTWSDSNYLSDNCYYLGAKEVAKKGAIPKVEYEIEVIDLSALSQFNEYDFDVADVTYVEDENLIGISQVTGLPNKLKVIIAESTHVLDNPSKDSVKVQNFTTQFDDLFQQVTASVQSLSFNENIYKRASNFTSDQSIKSKSLQGALSNNDVTLVNTSENNINIDANGQSGSSINNHSNKYKLDGQGLKFSNNGGQTWNVGVGPDGINADYIKVGSLDASKIQIIDGNYLYFLWDKTGITAYRDPSISKESQTLKDYARFNKYGLTLSEGGTVRLRAGYEYYPDEKDKAIQGTNIGFYLYNDNGQVIFKTENDKDKTARLSLAGEIFATDKLSFKTVNSVKFSDGYTLYDIILNKTSTNYGNLAQLLTLAKDDLTDALFKSQSISKKYLINDVEYNVTFDNFVYKLLDIDGNFIKSNTCNLKYVTNNLSSSVNVTWWNMKTYICDNSTNKAKICQKTAQTLEVKDSVPMSTDSFDVYVANGTTSYIKQTMNNYYLIDNVYYKNMEIVSQDEDLNDNQIAVFINNQHLNSSQMTQRRRMICCAEQNANGIKNIFSVTNNGELYIGGRITQFNKNGNEINNNDLSKLSDYIEINGDMNTVKLDKNGLSMGGKSLQAYVQEQISNAATTHHTHKISWNTSYAPTIDIMLHSNGTTTPLNLNTFLQYLELQAIDPWV